MNIGLFSAASALNTNQKWLESVSENLASQPIPGFKRTQMVVGAEIAGEVPKEYHDVANEGPTSYLLPTSKAALNFSQGDLKRTEVKTDFALEGKGFFVVQTPGGDEVFTRDGEFKFSADGQLVNKEGYPVLGDAGPIFANALNDAQIFAEPDGTIRQGQQILGKLRVVDFGDLNNLEPYSGGLFKAKQGAPGPVEIPETKVRQGYLESANVSTVKEMAGLILAMRNYEANQKVIQNADDKLGKAIQALGESAS